MDFNLCNGCGVCERACAYAAIKIHEGAAEVDEKSCFGCGLCATLCPTRAIKLG
ncbi:MAG: 4Fe-4S binding protein [Candidatus Hadarchaeum sp.]|uniref:4Fe-4S binding protein n=1 Tax=Candidatus Hadarchaeum sp. TaxID=2883567 RepID=UPI003D137226